MSTIGRHAVFQVAAEDVRGLDPRLVVAMEALSRRDIRITRAAAEAGLSPQRLRVLARRLREVTGLTPAVVASMLRQPR